MRLASIYVFEGCKGIERCRNLLAALSCLLELAQTPRSRRSPPAEYLSCMVKLRPRPCAPLARAAHFTSGVAQTCLLELARSPR